MLLFVILNVLSVGGIECPGEFDWLCKVIFLWLKTLYLLTYLISHNNSIKEFRPAATHPSRCLCFLHANDSWSHQSMTGLFRFGPSNGYKVILFADFRRSPHQIPISLEHPTPFKRHGRASAVAGY